MNKFVKWLLSSIVFIIVLPVAAIVAYMMLFWYQGMGFNGIFQLIIVICIVLAVSFEAAKIVFDKLSK